MPGKVATSIVLALTCSVITPTQRSEADSPSFSVRTTLRGEQGGPPLAIHRLLFYRGVAYDVTDVPSDQTRFITVFDLPGEEIMLLDEANQIRSSIRIETLAEATARVRAEAEKGDSQKLGLAAEPGKSADGSRYWIAFDVLRYETSVQQPQDDSIAVAFGQLTDWAARLNIARQVNAPPPFARLALNQALASDGQIPQTLIFCHQRGGRDVRWFVEHELRESLSEQERASIESIRESMADYRQVSWTSFPR